MRKMRENREKLDLARGDTACSRGDRRSGLGCCGERASCRTGFNTAEKGREHKAAIHQSGGRGRTNISYTSGIAEKKGRQPAEGYCSNKGKGLQTSLCT